MNKCIFTGNLTKDPESRTTTTGVQVANFTIAVKKRNSDEALFLRVNAWRGLSEICTKFLSKGSKIAVSGYIDKEEYTTKDGSKRSDIVLTAEDIEFLTSKSENASEPKKTAKESKPVEHGGAVYTPVDMDEELPF